MDILEFEENQTSNKKEIDDLNMKNYLLRGTIESAIFRIADIYKLYTRLQDSMADYECKQRDENFKFDPNSFNKNTNPPKSIWYPNLFPATKTTIEKAFRDIIKSITLSDWRYAQNFLVRCEKGNIDEIAKSGMKQLELNLSK
jgi:hypothetical protein